MSDEQKPQLMGSKAAATTHPAEPRATLAAWMLLRASQNRPSSPAPLEALDCVEAFEAWEADLDARLGKQRARRSRWARIFQWGRK